MVLPSCNENFLSKKKEKILNAFILITWRTDLRFCFILLICSPHSRNNHGRWIFYASVDMEMRNESSVEFKFGYFNVVRDLYSKVIP